MPSCGQVAVPPGLRPEPGGLLVPNLDEAVLDMAARLLERDEREALLGDLAEMHASSWRATLEILGLLLRRQAALWSHWRPWLAALGLSLPGALLLQGTSFSVSCTYQGLTAAGLCAGWGPAGREQLVLLPCLATLLTLGSWSVGFLIGFISRRTFWASAMLAALPCLYCQSKFHELAVPRVSLLLFVPWMIVGARQALRSIRIKPTPAIALAAAAAISIAMFVRISNTPWTLNWALAAPVWCISVVAFRPDLLALRKPPAHG